MQFVSFLNNPELAEDLFQDTITTLRVENVKISSMGVVKGTKITLEPHKHVKEDAVRVTICFNEKKLSKTIIITNAITASNTSKVVYIYDIFLINDPASLSKYSWKSKVISLH